jgi:phospholipid transport system substrate-binding protein
LGGAQAAEPQTATIERFHAALIDNMKNGKALGFEGRRAKLAPIVKETFDIPTMARISTGAAAWAKMSDADKAEITEAFGHWTTASYAGNFSTWNGESFVTKGLTPDDGRGNVLVNTQLLPKGMSPVAFNYRMQKSGETWKVVDIFLDGAISQLATFRAQFATVLSKGTPADLVAHMNKLAEEAKAKE